MHRNGTWLRSVACGSYVPKRVHNAILFETGSAVVRTRAHIIDRSIKTWLLNPPFTIFPLSIEIWITYFDFSSSFIQLFQINENVRSSNFHLMKENRANSKRTPQGKSFQIDPVMSEIASYIFDCARVNYLRRTEGYIGARNLWSMLFNCIEISILTLCMLLSSKTKYIFYSWKILNVYTSFHRYISVLWPLGRRSSDGVFVLR